MTIAEAGDRTSLTLTWTHPESWRDLNTVDVRLHDEHGVVLWVRFDEAAGTFSVCDTSERAVAATSHSEALSRLTVADRRSDMIKWVLGRAIDKVERDWNYDASYMRDMIDASPRAAWLFSRVTALGQFRRDLPIEAWCAAGITTVPA